VPKATVNEDGKPVPPKDEVGLAGQGRVPAPAGDAVVPKQFGQHEFGLFVSAAANRGHDG
jgi:hypothetical protein